MDNEKVSTLEAPAAAVDRRATYVAEAIDKGYTPEAAEKIAGERLMYDELVADGVSEAEAADLVWPTTPESPIPDPGTTPAEESPARAPAASPTPDPAPVREEPTVASESLDGVLVLDANLNVLRDDPTSATGKKVVEYRWGTPISETDLTEQEIDEFTAQRHIVLRVSKSQVTK